MLYTTSVSQALAVAIVYNSFVYDYLMRARVVGLGIDYHVLEQTPLPRFHELLGPLAVSARMAETLCLTAQHLAPARLELRDADNGRPSQPLLPALTISERTRFRTMLEALVAVLFGLNYSDLHRILEDCDLAPSKIAGRNLNPKGFWRIDKDLDPEIRYPILTLVAFQNLESKIREASGNRDEGIVRFLAQNGGEGWLLPETLRLADYGLGHDDRASSHQPVAYRSGPRFYDWQLAQSAGESRRECHLHARNLLGGVGYARLIEAISLGDSQSGFGGSAVTHDQPQGMPDDGAALRVAEPRPEYAQDAVVAPAQTELLRRRQADLFESPG